MRRVVCNEFGPPDRLVIEEVDPPRPGADQVVIEVRAAGVTYVDALLVAGGYQLKPPLPFTPGGEVAGIVTDVAPDVSSVDVGDRVAASTFVGGFADRVAVPAAAAVPVPPGLDLPRAATLLQAYGTMWFAFTRRCPLEPGQVVLVLGAGGGVGLAAVDVARSFGARVIGAASSAEKRRAAERAGAEATIDYTTEDLKLRARELSGGGVDVVVDPVGGAHAEPALRALGWGGRFCVLGFASGEIPRVPLNLALLTNRSVLGVDWGAWVGRNPVENQALVREVLAHAGDGRLRPPVPEERPLTDAPAVLTDVLERRIVGKVALIP